MDVHPTKNVSIGIDPYPYFITFGSCLSHFGTIPPIGPVSCGDILFQNWSLGEDPPVIPLIFFLIIIIQSLYIFIFMSISCPWCSIFFHYLPWFSMIFHGVFPWYSWIISWNSCVFSHQIPGRPVARSTPRPFNWSGRMMPPSSAWRATLRSFAMRCAWRVGLTEKGDVRRGTRRNVFFSSIYDCRRQSAQQYRQCNLHECLQMAFLPG